MKLKNISRNRIILILVIIISVVLIIWCTIFPARRRSNFRKFENMRSEINEVVPDLIDDYFGDYQYVENVSATASSTFEKNSRYDWYDWKESIDVNVYVDSTFDALTEKAQYDYINTVGKETTSAVRTLINENFPKHSTYGDFPDNEKVLGKLVCFSSDYDIYIITSENTYQYSSNVRDYFLKNGKDVFLRDENGEWTGKSHSSSSSSSSNSSSSSSSSSSGSYTAVTDSDELATCWVLAQKTVKGQLKSPSTASFPFSYASSDVSITKSGNTYKVSAWVDAENSFGATVRSYFTVTMEKSGSKFTATSCVIN